MDPTDRIVNNFLNEIINPIFYLFVGITVMYFLGAAAFYIFQAHSEEARANLRSHMMYGLIGLFIIFSIGGILNLIDSLARNPLGN